MQCVLLGTVPTAVDALYRELERCVHAFCFLVCLFCIVHLSTSPFLLVTTMFRVNVCSSVPAGRGPLLVKLAAFAPSFLWIQIGRCTELRIDLRRAPVPRVRRCLITPSNTMLLCLDMYSA
jgi:hypothetical protein